MIPDISDRLTELGLYLPAAPAPAANYVPYVISGRHIFISGQLPFENGKLITGRLGADVGLKAGVEAAKLCALALLAQANAAVNGDCSKIARLVKITGFVNSTPEFTDQPTVINGASDLMVQVLGDAGRHARVAVSAPVLPFDAAVEIDAIFELK